MEGYEVNLHGSEWRHMNVFLTMIMKQISLIP